MADMIGTDELLLGVVVWIIALVMTNKIMGWSLFQNVILDIMVVAIAFGSFILSLWTRD